MRVPASIRWLGLGLLGILIAAGVSVAASSLASRQIGLASEPISAGETLAPAMRMQAMPYVRTRHRRHKRRQTRVPTSPSPAGPAPQTTEEPSPSPPVPASPGDHSSADSGDHSGGGADD